MLHLTKYILTYGVGLVSAIMFQLLNIPIPWLLGPIVATFALQLFTSIKLKWDGHLRDAGIILVSLTLGGFFTADIFASIPHYIVPLLILNLVLIGFSLLLSWITAKVCGINFVTALVSSVPGGLSQLILFAEEKEAVNLPVVTYFHIIRVFLVVSLVPLIMSTSAIGITVANDAPIMSLSVIILIILGYIAMRFAKVLRLPVAALLGPLILVICLNVFQVEHAIIQVELLQLAQILVGCHIGLSLKREDLQLSKQILIMGAVSAISLIGMTMLTGYIFSKLDEISYETAFLSLAPGGLDQMSLIALNVGGDVALVTLFQLFRILVILLIVLPIMNITIK